MEWFKKHADTVIVLGAIISSITWMNGRFSQIDKDINEIKNTVSIIKAVLFVKGIYPAELVKNEQNKEK